MSAPAPTIEDGIETIGIVFIHEGEPESSTGDAGGEPPSAPPAQPSPHGHGRGEPPERWKTLLVWIGCLLLAALLGHLCGRLAITLERGLRAEEGK
jgi:hypothetical protein